MEWLLVGVGSALGGMARYGLTVWSAALWGESFPWGTILINVAGSFVIGVAAATPMAVGARLFVMTGLCGGFTTFSAFSLQTLVLLRQGGWAPAVANIGLSVVVCLLAVAAGYLVAAARP